MAISFCNCSTSFRSLSRIFRVSACGSIGTRCLAGYSVLRRFGDLPTSSPASGSGGGFRGEGFIFVPLLLFDLLLGVLCIPDGGVVTIGSSNPRWTGVGGKSGCTSFSVPREFASSTVCDATGKLGRSEGRKGLGTVLSAVVDCAASFVLAAPTGRLKV